jgi:phosphatidylethanolamine/phosphatidyl-N-methylethanolamine N-methyltransferase
MANGLKGSILNASHRGKGGQRPMTTMQAPSVIDDGRPRGRNHARATAAALTRETIIGAYRRYAPIYDRLFGAVLEPGRRALADAVSAAKPRTVLEVGVGTGLTLHHYPESCQVVGIDICEAMLAKALRRADCLWTRRIQLEAMDAEAMRFGNGSFDCVTVPYVLSVTPNPHRLVTEIRRVCKKDGLILVLNHFSGSRGWRSLESITRMASARLGFRSEFDLNDNVLNHAWHVESIKAVNLLGLSRLVVIRNS